jgi:hypothetical protein
MLLCTRQEIEVLLVAQPGFFLKAVTDALDFGHLVGPTLSQLGGWSDSALQAVAKRSLWYLSPDMPYTLLAGQLCRPGLRPTISIARRKNALR